MNRLSRLALSSVGSKYVMSLTGLGLMIFVIAHMIGNLLIYAGRDALNSYAHGLTEHPVLLWSARGGLLAIFVIHMLFALRTWQENESARPVGYVRKDYVEANWASRHMMLTGCLLLAFVIYHLMHFTFGVVVDPDHFKYSPEMLPDPMGRPDVAGMVVAGFRNPSIAVIYVLFQIFLGLHLWHGGSSWLQHLGLNGRGYDGIVNHFGAAIALIVVVGNCSIPLAVLMRWIY